MASADDDITVVSMGCRLNTFESEVMRQNARAAGLGKTVIINTCAVTGEAVRQARQTVRKAASTNPDAQILVTGCAAQLDPQTFAGLEGVSNVIGNDAKVRPETFAALAAGGLEKVAVNDIMSVRETAGHLVGGYGNRARAYVQVQNGCDHRCTFCIIPYGRGNARSVPAGEVVMQCQRLVDAGHAEIVLTGVDLTSYGVDLPGTPTLGRLVQQIVRHVPDLPRLRLSSIDQVEADEALVDVVTGEPRVMPHLHLSLQAGADMILKRMKRRHLRDDAIAFCAQMRARRPEIVFGADLIAGFPTETETHFEDSIALAQACGLTYLHVFPFSPRQGTPAARMPQLPGPVVRARAERLRSLGRKLLDAHLAAQAGRTLHVLVERVATAGYSNSSGPGTGSCTGTGSGRAAATGSVSRGRAEGFEEVLFEDGTPDPALVGAVVPIEITGQSGRFLTGARKVGAGTQSEECAA